jgi:hypothetical protein
MIKLPAEAEEYFSIPGKGGGAYDTCRRDNDIRINITKILRVVRVATDYGLPATNLQLFQTQQRVTPHSNTYY